jgi:hypothetical protein
MVFQNGDIWDHGGAINILNKPDAIWMSARGEAWMRLHNIPWIRRSIERGDDIYLASNPDKINLLLYSKLTKEKPSITAYELRELYKANKKPINISATQWDLIRKELEIMEGNKLFVNY